MTDKQVFARALVVLKASGWPTIKAGRTPSFGAVIELFDDQNKLQDRLHAVEMLGANDRAPWCHLYGVVQVLTFLRTHAPSASVQFTLDAGPMVNAIRGEASRDAHLDPLWEKLDALLSEMDVTFIVRPETVEHRLIIAKALSDAMGVSGGVMYVSRVRVIAKQEELFAQASPFEDTH